MSTTHPAGRKGQLGYCGLRIPRRSEPRFKRLTLPSHPGFGPLSTRWRSLSLSELSLRSLRLLQGWWEVGVPAAWGPGGGEARRPSETRPRRGSGETPAAGGGFFSSSASGYSSGLALLLLGRKNEERPMRVSPWNQYQLVEQDLDPDVQLASRKDQVSRGCVSFICFGRVSAGIDGNSPPKVGPAHQTDSINVTPPDKEKVPTNADIEEENGRKECLKSSLKKNPSSRHHEALGDTVIRVAGDEEKANIPVCMDRRKVQWTDTCGRELVEIREFELSV
ncbi:hypothetical protein Taro_007942 [Colocasia esculenta]|uniref:Uncharacterized protein n=1 Tax=Colocasia esculenta TaxID=4460 RepID=A0A843U5I3_COLES|nr:hypothetical protein [Colocasia esculenta]